MPTANRAVEPTVPNPPSNITLHIPSDAEAKDYLYGLPSRPRLIARTNPEVWMEPTGPDARLEPKELIPLGAHPLCAVWETTLIHSLLAYLVGKQLQLTLLNALLIGVAQDPSPSPFILVGVNHDTLSSQAGLDAAVVCRSILVENGFDDVHIIVLETTSSQHKALYEPALTSNPVAVVREPFSTTLGISMAYDKSPGCEGTGGFYFIDKAKPGTLYICTTRHHLFDPEKEPNTLFDFRNGKGPRRKVIYMASTAFKRNCSTLQSAIVGQEAILAQLNKRMEFANEIEDEEMAKVEKADIEGSMVKAKAAMAAIQTLLADVNRDWSDEENRVIGHVVLSPPIKLGFGNEKFTDDWAIVEIYPSMIARFNFVGNVIDLGSVAVDTLKEWMYPVPSNPPSFVYPGDRLLRFSGVMSDEDMYKPNPKTQDCNNDPVNMVLKNGSTTGLTVGRLNTVRAVVRVYAKNKPELIGESMEMCVIPRTNHSGSFSKGGDSGSAVVEGSGRLCGILTGGCGPPDASDYTYVTSINFLLKRFKSFGIDANIFPLPGNL